MNSTMTATAIAVGMVFCAPTAQAQNADYNQCVTDARNWFEGQMGNCGRRTQQTVATCKAEVDRQYAQITKRCRDTQNASVARAAAQAREIERARAARNARPR